MCAARAAPPAVLFRSRQFGLPVLVTYPRWDTIETLSDKVTADSGINIGTIRCTDCWSRAMLKSMSPQPIMTSPTFRVWTHDSYAVALHLSVIPSIHRNARKMLQLGFKQASKKPEVLWFPLPAEDGAVFAKFWEGPKPSIYCTGLTRSPDIEKVHLTRTAHNICRSHGIDVRELSRN